MWANVVFNSTFTYSAIHKDYQVILLLLFLVLNYNYSESWIFSPHETINTQKAVTKINCHEKSMKGASQTSLERSRILTLGNVKKAASRYETFLSSNEIDNEEHDVLFQDLFKSWNELG